MRAVSSNSFVCLFLTATVSLPTQAENSVKAYELIYEEQETGTAVYQNRYRVTDNYLRIDEPGDDSGYILFDNRKSTIYSVSHFNQSILVIKAQPYILPDMKGRVSTEYKVLEEAPKITGKPVYNYRVVATDSDNENCMELQLVEGWLPEVSSMFAAYQKVVTSQQLKLLGATPEEYQTTCFLYDQVYNEGLYYQKGLPVQEWHSNGRKKLLSSYKNINLDSSLLILPDGYRQYSIE